MKKKKTKYRNSNYRLNYIVTVNVSTKCGMNMRPVHIKWTMATPNQITFSIVISILFVRQEEQQYIVGLHKPTTTTTTGIKNKNSVKKYDQINHLTFYFFFFPNELNFFPFTIANSCSLSPTKINLLAQKSIHSVKLFVFKSVDGRLMNYILATARI